jgi:hypothetical protein
VKFSQSAEQFLIKALGQEGLDALHKTEIFKIRSNKTLDHEEIRTAMQIVPRTILSLLHRELSPMGQNEGKDITLPVSPEAILHVTKYENDVYSGDIRRGGKILVNFQDRSIPGVGLIVMSAFELYDVSQLASAVPAAPAASESTIQSIIDDRIGIRDLVRQVVDQRLTEREAIDNLIRMRLTQAISEATKEASPKNSRLKKFIENRSKKAKEHTIVMGKSESVVCEDCKKEIFTKGMYSGCVCYGDDMNSKIFIKKNENGFSMRFPRSWDIENINMLLDTFRNKNRG